MKIWPKASHVDWLSYGREFHNKALPLLRELLDQLKMRDANNTILNQDGDELQQRKCLQESHELVPQIDLDDLLAAAAILCEYEFLDGSCINWSVHLTGTKSLLDEVHCRMMPLDPQCLNRTKARKAVFWNFARQDFVAACKQSSYHACLFQILIINSHQQNPNPPLNSQHPSLERSRPTPLRHRQNPIPKQLGKLVHSQKPRRRQRHALQQPHPSLL